MAPSVNNNGATETTGLPKLWISGLGTQYPLNLQPAEKLEEIATRFHDVERPGLKKLLQINRKTGIETRATVSSWETGFGCQPDPPTITDIDNYFRQVGVDLAAQACRKALGEWGGSPADITHTVAVTCTTQGNPGYDLLVAREIELRPNVDRTLLHGVGCAGGLSIMRAAAEIACGATARGRPARVLAFACEICSPNIRRELADAEACTDNSNVCVAAALFSDCAAAFVLCNDKGMLRSDGGNLVGSPVYQVLDWDSSTIPDTTQHLSFYVGPAGFRTTLTRQVASFSRKAAESMFHKLLPSWHEITGLEDLDATDFDWALHPGGETIIQGVHAQLGLTDEQLRATRRIYKTRGNSSSASVLAVLDLLRTMGRGKDHVIATSFGPGMIIEMAMLRRVRQDGH